MGDPTTRYYGTVSADVHCEVRRKIAIIMLVMSLVEICGAVLAVYRCVVIYKSKGEYRLERQYGGSDECEPIHMVSM